MYNDKIIDHFKNPRNSKRIKNPDGVGKLGDPGCGDYIEVYIKVEDEKLIDVGFQICGCPAAIACGSAMTEIAIGKTIDEAGEISDKDIVDYLGGLPANKEHCSNLGAGALQNAILDCFVRSLKGSNHIQFTDNIIDLRPEKS